MAVNREYWTRRAEENDARNQKFKDLGIEKVRQAFEIAEEAMLARIEKYYRTYESDGEISLADARKRLTPSELADYRKQISKLSKTASTPEEKARLEQLKRKVYISRQEALLAEIRHHAIELAAKTERTIGESLTEIYTSQEEHQQYNIEQDLRWGVNFEGLSPDQIQALIHQNYGEEDFSKTVWHNTSQLVKNLNVLLPQQFMLGRSTQDLARELSKLMKTPRYSAERAIRTEGANVAAQADMLTYKGASVETYEFFATLDSRTSDICASLDGMHFAVSEGQAGVNLPPMHSNCRSTTLPDVDMEGFDETRLAKDEDGQYIVVPKQTFSQWKSSLKTRTEAQASLSGAAVSRRDFTFPFDNQSLLAQAQKLATGEVPADVYQAKDDPELLKKIRANAQTTFNENAARYRKADQQLFELDDEYSPEGMKLKADMDRYANKMVLYANKLKAIDSRAWERIPEAHPVAQSYAVFTATTSMEMRYQLRKDFNVETEQLSDANTEHLYTAIQRMYEVEPEMVEVGLKKMPLVKYFSEHDQKSNPRTYAWVYRRSAKMELNPKYFDDIKVLNASYANDIRISWHPRGGDGLSILVHEFGHVVENAYFGNTGTNKMANAIERAFARAKREDEYWDQKYSNKTEWKERISEYATRNNAETFAEAWTDWIDNGEDASEASKLIIAEVKKEIAKLKGGDSR